MLEIILQVANGEVQQEITNIFWEYFNAMTPILILIIVAVIFGLIIDRISQDRVIKLFKGNWVVLFYEDVDKNGLNEAYIGKIKVPPRAEGGFEIEYSLGAIENPVKLIGYLKRAYKETGNDKYLRKAQELYEHLKAKGKIDIEFDEIKYDPFTEPSQASKKVYKNNIKDIYAIVRFEEHMSPREKEKKRKELAKIFHPGIIYRFKRSTVNFLLLVKDKLKSAVGVMTGMLAKFAPITPDISKEVKKYGETALGKIGSYEALLETSIGKLVKVKVMDVDRVERFYNGILREYSPNYIAVYNVDFPIDEEAIFIGDKLLDNFPRERLDFHGWRLDEPPHVEIINYRNDGKKLLFDIRNIHSDHIFIEKIRVGDKEVKLEDPNFLPGEVEHVEIEGEFSDKPQIHVLYKIIKVADVIWPTSKAKVVGSGEPTENLVKEIFRTMKTKIKLDL